MEAIRRLLICTAILIVIFGIWLSFDGGFSIWSILISSGFAIGIWWIANGLKK